MRKIKRPKIGQYVLLTKYRDRDPLDPWVLGFVETILEDKTGFSYRCKDSKRFLRVCFKLSFDEGSEWYLIADEEPKK